jgi:hypothetical protein
MKSALVTPKRFFVFSLIGKTTPLISLKGPIANLENTYILK